MNRTIIILCLCISQAAFSQNWIKLKDKKMIKNIEVWEIRDSSIVYEKGGTLHDLFTKSIDKIVTSRQVIIADEHHHFHYISFDTIITLNEDTIKCIITSMDRNKIYYTRMYDFSEINDVVYLTRTKQYIRQGVKSQPAFIIPKHNDRDTSKSSVSYLSPNPSAKRSTPFCFFYVTTLHTTSDYEPDELGLELGLEVKLVSVVSFYQDVGFMPYDEGFTSRTGLKCYVFSRESGRQKCHIRLYFSPHFAYKYSRYMKWDNDSSAFVWESGYVGGVNFTSGFQIIFGRKFTMEVFSGLGLAYFKRNNEFQPNVQFGFKVGFSF